MGPDNTLHFLLNQQEQKKQQEQKESGRIMCWICHQPVNVSQNNYVMSQNGAGAPRYQHLIPCTVGPLE